MDQLQSSWWRTLNLLTCVAFVFWFGVIYVVMTMVTRGSRRALDFVNALFELWIGRWNCKVQLVSFYGDRVL